MKKFALLFALCVLSAAESSAANHKALSPINPPEQAQKPEDVETVKELLARGSQDRKAAIRRLKKGLSENQPLGEIAVRSLREISRRRAPYYPLLYSVKVGDIGVLCETYWNSVGLQSFEVIQVVDDKNMLVKFGDDDFCWVTDFPTKGLSDGDSVEGLASVLEVTGSKQYNTAVGGMRTVPQIEPYRLDLNTRKKK